MKLIISALLIFSSLQASSLVEAIASGDLDSAREMIREGKGLDKKEGGICPLNKAIQMGHPDIANLLISSGADLNVKNSSGETPLMMAIHRGFEGVARKIIEAGADLTIENSNGKTALDLAKKKHFDGLVNLISSKIK